MTTETEATVETDGNDTAAVLAAASGEKTYIGGDEGEQPEEPAAEETGDDAAAAQPDEGEAQQPKPRKTAQQRIDELTWRAHEAERREQALIDRLGQPTSRAEPQPQGDGKPDPEKFDGGVYDPAYIDALTDWKADRAVQQHFAKHQAQTRVQTALEKFDASVAEQYPDGEPAGITALKRAPNVPQSVFDLVTSSEIAPKLADYLGTNQREFDALSAMPPHLQGREIARLEQTLSAPPKVPPKTATDAPEAAPILRGNGGRFKVAGDTSDFAAFEAQYKLGG